MAETAKATNQEEDYYGGGQLPPVVEQFVDYFYRHIMKRNIQEMQQMYDVSFVKITQRLFQGQPWPHVEVIAPLVQGDDVFCYLYQELYFRHFYAQCQPTLVERQESWHNYRKLFNCILNEQQPLTVSLPVNWLHDMIDEFCYQFQSFCQYRAKLTKKTPMELEELERCKDVWDPAQVLTFLQGLVERSKIREFIAKDGGQALYDSDGYFERGRESNVLRMLGYFALLGLLRIHTLLGDYWGALKALYPINLHDKKGLFTYKVAGAHITLFYYAGFCYLMLGRYLDCTRTFNNILMYISRVKSQYQRSLNYDQMLKKQEQMYALLALTVALQPPCNRLLDDTVSSQLKEKYQDKMASMQRGDLGSFRSFFDQLFSYSCPKFITSYLPDYANPVLDTNQNAYKAQLDIFMKQVKLQEDLAKLKQFLKLYTSISIEKLASLMSTDESTVLSTLLYYKQRTIAPRHDGQVDATSGRLVSFTDVEFYLDLDDNTGKQIVMVVDSKPQKKHIDFLRRHVQKFSEIINDLENPGVATQPVSDKKQ